MQLNLFGEYESALTYVNAREHVRLSRTGQEVNRRLSRVYVIPDYDAPRLTPLEQLIYAILSQRTKAPQADAAFTELSRAFRDWKRVLDAPVEKVERVIVTTTFPEKKARWLQAVLLEILEWNDGNRLSLNLLRDLGDAEAAAFLRTLTGVGWKTSNATLLLSNMHRALLPVDMHGWRVRMRLGLIPEGLNESRLVHAIARALLPESSVARDIEREYFAVKRHGQNCCTYSYPQCFRCPLVDLCKYGRTIGNIKSEKLLS